MTYRMPFGKHKGKLLRDLPDTYLAWLLGLSDLREPLKTELRLEGERRVRSYAPPKPARELPPRETAEEIITAGYRQVALRRHPDHGGTHDEMLAVNAAADWLRRQIFSLPEKTL